MNGGSVAMVMAGGVSLGAYQAGAYEAMPQELRRRLRWVAGSSIGAVNGAILAGSAAGERQEALSQFWDELARSDPAPVPSALRDGAWARPFSWLNVTSTRLLGRSGLFRPQVLPLRRDALGLYRLDGLREVLHRRVDFERLNGGEIRLSVVATDLATGEQVVFDTGGGDRIEVDHILASCGFLPDFEPTEIAGRLLGDDALFANAPVEVVLEERADDEEFTAFVIDLRARDLGPPRSLAGASELRRDLLLANPTHRALDLLEREDALRPERLKRVPRSSSTFPARASRAAARPARPTWRLRLAAWRKSKAQAAGRASRCGASRDGRHADATTPIGTFRGMRDLKGRGVGRPEPGSGEA